MFGMFAPADDIMGALPNCEHSRWDYTIGFHLVIKVYKL
jgi:hypothetical protein